MDMQTYPSECQKYVTYVNFHYLSKLYKPKYVFKYMEEIKCMPYLCIQGGKQVINNSRNFSLLQICGKIFEGLTFKNKLLSAHQSGFLANTLREEILAGRNFGRFGRLTKNLPNSAKISSLQN